MRPRIGYVRLGPRPLANETLEGVLAEHLSEFDIVTIDLKAELDRDRAALGRMAAAMVGRYGVGVAKGRRDPKIAIFRTPTAQLELRRLALRRLAADPCVATIQIQSLFDASVPGVPHLVFTDHTHLVNLSYPDFDPSAMFTRRWVIGEQAVFTAATRVLTRSTNVAASIVGQYGIDIEKVSCVYFGTNVVVGEPDLEARDPFEILFVGVDWHRKGGPELVEAFERVRRVEPRARLTVVGCSPELPEGGTAWGRLPAAEVADRLNRAGIFCLPTRVEPFGVVFAEALGAGLPIVGTRVGAVPDMVSPGDNGVLVAPGDVDALASALTELVGHRERQLQMGAASLELARARYSWDTVGGRIRSHLLEVMSGSEDGAASLRPGATSVSGSRSGPCEQPGRR